MASLHLALVETAARGQKGSMARYGDLVAQALGPIGAGTIEISRIRLALPQAVAALLPLRLRPWAHHAWIALASGRRLRHLRADVVHIADGSHAYVARWVRQRPLVITVHDLIPLLQTLGRIAGPRPSRAARSLIRASVEHLRQADRLIVDSAQTGRDLETHAGIDPAKIVTVPIALVSAPVSASRPPARVSTPYLLHVGNGAAYKNRAGVLRVFARVRQRCPVLLKMAGAPPDAALRDLCGRLGISTAVEFIPEPDDARLAELYRNAALLLFPSLYEGFGWPPLEAMAAGCPVVCSNAASLPEVVGDAALTCAAGDEETMAANVLRVLEDPDLARSLVGRGRQQTARFSLERFAQGLLASYQSVLSSRAA